MKTRIISIMMVAALLLATSSLLTGVAAAGVTESDAHASQRQVAAAGAYALSVESPAVAPQVSAVSPEQGYNYQPTIITISGADFTGVPTVTLGLNILSDVTLVDSTTLSATVAAELPSGSYDLTVTNPDGESATLAAAFTALSSVDGTLGPWTPEQQMITPRSFGAAVAVGNYIYVMGGYNYATSSYLNSVERATVSPDGSISGWQSMPAMTRMRYGLAAVASGGYLYAVGGSTNSNHDTAVTVERAVINPDGSLGPWQAARAMTNEHEEVAAVVSHGYLYAIGGTSRVGNSGTVERARINADGSLGLWEQLNPLPSSLRSHQAIVAGNYLYVLGGSIVNAYQSTVLRATINLDGTLGSWQSERSMPEGRSAFGAIADNGYLYAIGGGTNAPTYNLSSVLTAPIYTDGTLGPWKDTMPMPTPRGGFLTAVAGKYVYALSGATSFVAGSGASSGATNIRAELNPLAALAFIPQAVQSGQSTTVTLTGNNFRATPAVSLGGTSLAVSFVSTTTLSVEIPAGLANGWYSAVITNPDGSSVTLQNALVVDDNAPAGSITFNNGAAYTASLSATLTLSATDDLSGVDRVAFSDDGTTFGAIQPYATNIPWPLAPGDGAKTLYAHFIDKAGNVSTTVSDTITLDTTAPDGALAVNGGADYATATVVTLALSATDSTSGPYQMSFSNNDSSWSDWQAYASSASWTLAAGDGAKTVYVRFSDNAGNISTTASDGIILDTVAPSAHVTGLGFYQAASSLTVSWSGTDATSGISSYDVQYRDNGGTWVDWQLDTSATSAVFTGVEGHRYDFRARALDAAGNQGSYAAIDAQIVIDTLAPTGAFRINQGALSTTAEAVNLSSAVTDSSGVNDMSFSNDGSNWSSWRAYHTAASWSLTAGDGNKTVYARYRDRAGNISLVSDSIVLDSSVPAEYGVSINEGDLFTNGVTVTLTLGAPQGTGQIKVSNDGGFAGAVWEPYAAHKEWVITRFGSYVIPRVVYVRYGDPGGNVLTTEQDDIILDVTPPTGEVSIASAGTQAKAPVAQPAAASGMSVRLNLTANDDVSGVGEMMLSNRPDLAGASWEQYASSRTWQLGSNNTVYVRFRDYAHNVSATYSAMLAGPAATGTATRTATAVATRTATRTATSTASATRTVTSVATSTRTSIATVTRTSPATSTRTSIGTSTATSIATSTRTSPATSIATSTLTSVATSIATSTATSPATSTRTSTATSIASATGTATSTSVAASTSTTTATNTTTVPPSTGTASPTSTATVLPFTDVPSDAYFYVPVNYLASRGVLSGYSCGTDCLEFRPYNNATRGQMVKIIVLAEQLAVATPATATFRDVPSDNAFYLFVETAAAHNIVSGYGCGAGCLEFRPYNNVTRGQLVKIIVSAAGWPTIHPPTAHFNDVPTTDPFYDFVETAFGRGIISGYSDATFRPGANATRGQIAKIVWQAVTQ